MFSEVRSLNKAANLAERLFAFGHVAKSESLQAVSVEASIAVATNLNAYLCEALSASNKRLEHAQSSDDATVLGRMLHAIVIIARSKLGEEASALVAYDEEGCKGLAQFLLSGAIGYPGTLPDLMQGVRAGIALAEFDAANHCGDSDSDDNTTASDDAGKEES